MRTQPPILPSAGRWAIPLPRCGYRGRMRSRLVVLVSGAGTNLQALLDACADEAYGADVVAVGCPFCMTMMEDGINARKGERDVRVMDVSELLWEASKPGAAENPAQAI